VNVWLTLVVTVAAVAVAICLLVGLRRYAPSGGYFSAREPAAAVYTVIGTAFAVILGFVIFLAFESYTAAKSSAVQEAVAVSEMYRHAATFPSRTGEQVRGELRCYARAVIFREWPAMRNHESSPDVEHWIASLDNTVDGAAVTGAKQSAGYSAWLQASSDRNDGRRGRLAEASLFVPPPLWLVLAIGALLLMGFTCLFADPVELVVPQSLMVGALTALVVLSLSLVQFLGRPYQDSSGSIQPMEMTHTLRLIEQSQPGPLAANLCDSTGLGGAQ
jgi:hypothetical protein